MKKFLSLVLALAMTMSLLAGCGGSSDTAADDTSGSVSDTAADDNTVVDGSNQVEVDMTQEPDGIVAGSYATCYSTADTVSTQIPNSYPGGRWLYALLYDTLFYSPDGTYDWLEGLLVSDYSISEDGLTWTMDIYEDAYFINGNPLDAAAVVRCLEYYMGNNGITNFAEVGTTGEYSFYVTMTALNSEFMQQMAVDHVAIFDVQTWEANTAAGMDTIEACVGIGSGPYYVSGYELGASLTLTANADHWNEARYPHIETIFCPVVSDTATQQTMLQAGDADCGIISDWTVMENLVDNYGLTYVTEVGTFRTLWMNTSGYSECLTDPVVREALTMMVDMEEVSIALSGNYGAYNMNCINTGVDYQHDYIYDPEAGLALLATTGYEPSDIVLTALSDTEQASIFSNVQSQLAEWGVTLNFVSQDNAALMSAGMAGEWDIWAETGGLAIGAYRTNIMNILSATAAQKVVLDPELSVTIAEMVEEAFNQTDSSVSMEMLEDICAVAAENYLYLGSVAVPTWHMANDTVVNYTLNKNGKFWMAWLSWMA